MKKCDAQANSGITLKWNRIFLKKWKSEEKKKIFIVTVDKINLGLYLPTANLFP